MEVKSETLHGRSVTYAKAGEGPALMLIHGMAGNLEYWREVIEPLARNHTVIAPDLPGHGESAPGAGDYSIRALASALRELHRNSTPERVTDEGGEQAHGSIPYSRLEIFEDVGHLPQLEAPSRFVLALESFLEETEPARFHREDRPTPFWTVRAVS